VWRTSVEPPHLGCRRDAVDDLARAGALTPTTRDARRATRDARRHDRHLEARALVARESRGRPRRPPHVRVMRTPARASGATPFVW
ncbi:MAG TPA: hypothetical protein VFS00_23010, partial [Polyangiaceae bacterium]|nr:hypothetical protein [Polyangiaceae bacterium]